MKRKDKYNYQFNWESINDVIYYMEWKLDEIEEAGCDLEYPSAEKTLKDFFFYNFTFNEINNFINFCLIFTICFYR